jgi:hypothetical protein
MENVVNNANIDARNLTMHDTLYSLIERALTGNPRPLEFYLCNQSRLPGPRANLELADDFANLLSAASARHPEEVHSLITYFAHGGRQVVIGNTPSEFVMLCGVIALGACAAVEPDWRAETMNLLRRYARSPYWRIREGVAIAYRSLLVSDVQGTHTHLMYLATQGDYLQQRAAIATVAEASVLYSAEMVDTAVQLQRVVLERLCTASPTDSKDEAFRILRRTLGYTLSVVTAADPEKGFALMRECAGWKNVDIIWILRENLKKKRLAKFARHAEELSRLLT